MTCPIRRCFLVLAALSLLVGCPSAIVTPTPSAPAPPPACSDSDLAMVWLPAGQFQMGSPVAEIGRKLTETRHPVTLSQGFCIATTEVTQALYVDVMGENPSADQDCGGTCPVERLSWHMAASFTNALSGRAGRSDCYTCAGEPLTCAPVEELLACDGYRLPTSAEWEMAARAQERAAFHDGGDFTHMETNRCTVKPGYPLDGRPDDIAWHCGNSADEVHQVAQLRPNAWGLYDMAGNVWEWANDNFNRTGYASEAVTDPLGPASSPDRTLRGGSYRYYPGYARSAYAAGVDPLLEYPDFGVRVVRTSDAP